MNIMVTGASGFVGSHLCESLLHLNHQVIGVGRTKRRNRISHPNYRFIVANTTRPGAWQQALAETDAVINLTGRSIFGRWTDAVKTEIRESRVQTTRHVVDALPQGKPVSLLNASGVGYYGSRGDEVLTENAPAGADFLARLSAEWEEEAFRAETKGARVVTMRFGVVLGLGGGAMAQMIPAFKSFVGGAIGSGRQWFPWIHRDDLSAAILFLLDNQGINGPVNMCSPNPVRNGDLAAALGKALNRPAVMPAPAFMIRILMGEFAEVLLASQRAVPEKLRQHGFSFRFPEIGPAVQAMVAAG